MAAILLSLLFLFQVTGYSSDCQVESFVCPGSSSTIYLPSINVTGIAEISVKISLNFIYSLAEVDVCAKFSSERLDRGQGAATCYTLSSGTPKTILIPSGMKFTNLEITPTATTYYYCTSIQRFTVKYDVCPCREEDLTVYPEVPKGKPGIVSGRCVENASLMGSLVFSTATCTNLDMDARCVCDPGHEKTTGLCQSE